jgi:hypothetical protein
MRRQGREGRAAALGCRVEEGESTGRLDHGEEKHLLELGALAASVEVAMDAWGKKKRWWGRHGRCRGRLLLMTPYCWRGTPRRRPWEELDWRPPDAQGVGVGGEDAGGRPSELRLEIWGAMDGSREVCSSSAFSGQRGHGSHAPALGEDGCRQAYRWGGSRGRKPGKLAGEPTPEGAVEVSDCSLGEEGSCLLPVWEREGGVGEKSGWLVDLTRHCWQPLVTVGGNSHWPAAPFGAESAGLSARTRCWRACREKGGARCVCVCFPSLFFATLLT